MQDTLGSSIPRISAPTECEVSFKEVYYGHLPERHLPRRLNMVDGKWPHVMRNSFSEKELEDMEPIIEFVGSPDQAPVFFTDGEGISKERLHCKPPEKGRTFHEEGFREEFLSFLAEEINGKYESLAAKLRARTVRHDEKQRKHFRFGGQYRAKLYLYLRRVDRGRVELLYDIF